MSDIYLFDTLIAREPCCIVEICILIYQHGKQPQPSQEKPFLTRGPFSRHPRDEDYDIPSASIARSSSSNPRSDGQHQGRSLEHFIQPRQNLSHVWLVPGTVEESRSVCKGVEEEGRGKWEENKNRILVLSWGCYLHIHPKNPLPRLLSRTLLVIFFVFTHYHPKAKSFKDYQPEYLPIF